MKSSGRRPTLLILNDQYPFRADLPNLGDRALQQGFRILCSRLSDCEVLSGRWKAFPHLTARRYRGFREPAAALDRWHRTASSYSAPRVALESRIAALLASPWVSDGARSWADRRVRVNTGLGVVAALEPRLLRAHHAARLLAQLAAADLVMFNAGGLIADHLGRYLPERLFQVALATRMRKPTAVVNYSVSLAEPRNVALGAAVLGAVDLHAVREPRSAERLAELGVSASRVIVSIDAAFAVDAPPPEPFAARGPDIGIMIRGDRAADLGAWSGLIERLRARTGARIHYLQGCHKHDPPVRRALGARCGLDDDGRALSLVDLLRAMGRMRLVITDRYHGAVFAIQTQTPLVAVTATTHKTDGLFSAFDYPVPVLPPLSMALVDSYLGWIDRALDGGPALAARLGAIHDEARRQLFTDYQHLFSRLGVARTPGLSP